jgi:hypothetical protein
VRVAHVPHAELIAALEHIRRSPVADGRIELIVRRPSVGGREVLEVGYVDERDGLVGDSWRTRGSSSTEDGGANPDAQITIMNARAVAVIAGTPDRWSLAGDQFYVDLDLSGANLPPRTRLALGDALLEVTPLPHRGCGKFLERFGLDASKFVNSAVGRELNLRGINARVVRGGAVRAADTIRRAAADET